MHMKKTLLILIGIICLAIFLRFYKLGTVPVSPDWDEASLGYNAYSILKTGKDEYGTFLPLSIRSFGDYKPPLYTYLTIPSVAMFGLSTWSTRLPSAVFGVLAVLGVYLLVTEIQMLSKNKKGILVGGAFPLLAALLLAISPWHLQFSRIAFESNIGVTMNIWAVVLFLRGLRQKIYLPFAVVLVCLGLYTYHSERIFLPLLVILLLAIFRKQLFRIENVRFIVFSGIIACVCIVPLLMVMFGSAGLERLKGTSAFTNQIQLLSRNIHKFEDDKNAGDKIGALLDNRRFVWVNTVISGYLSHFSIKWLFLQGDNPRHHAPTMGLLYLWELPFVLYGIFIILTTFSNPSILLILGWFLFSPVAASVTTGLPHAVRTLVFLPTFQIFTAVGLLYGVAALLRYKYVRVLVGIFFACVVLFNFAYYFDMYYAHLNSETSEDWQYGYENMVRIANRKQAKYKKIVVSTSLDQPYIFFLFYEKYDPARYLREGGTGAIHSDGIRFAFGEYEFRKIEWERENHDGSVLFIGAPGDIPQTAGDTYTYLNGKPSFIISK